ncbi:hypothetical protein [Micromonospora sp. NPDC005652]|uniref:hypothetical protein n=1 Tax=Micromonospora sp. NPDC005652 TaxID=3157046 RepID=UPI0033EB9BDA
MSELTEHRHPDPEAGPWRVQLTWRQVDGVPECVGLILLSDNPDDRITDSLLRKLQVSRLIAADRAQLAAHPAPGAGLSTSKRQRYERAAGIYRRALAAGEPPVKAVAAAEGLSQAGASALVVRVRQAGFLPPTSSGVASGGA